MTESTRGVEATGAPSGPAPTLHMIGYWRNATHPELPDPHDLVDEEWDEDDRFAVVGYLRHGTYYRGWMGLSPCRMCGRNNGSGELTDGVLAWPEGLAHYVEEHGVRLPPAVERHVLEAVDCLDATGSSVDWWVSGAPAPIPAGSVGPSVGHRSCPDPAGVAAHRAQVGTGGGRHGGRGGDQGRTSAADRSRTATTDSS